MLKEPKMRRLVFVRTDARIPVLHHRIILKPDTVEEFKETIKVRGKSTIHPKNETSLREFAATVAQAAKAGWGRSGHAE